LASGSRSSSKKWPKIHFKEKRGITVAEHARIIDAEKNPERRLYYQLLWETGAPQSDAAALSADNVNWNKGSISYLSESHEGSLDPQDGGKGRERKPVEHWSNAEKPKSFRHYMVVNWTLLSIMPALMA
jgi:hypothetical protein